MPAPIIGPWLWGVGGNAPAVAAGFRGHKNAPTAIADPGLCTGWLLWLLANVNTLTRG